MFALLIIDLNVQIAKQLEHTYTGSEIIPTKAKSACMKCKVVNFHDPANTSNTYTCGLCHHVNKVDIVQSSTRVVNDIFRISYVANRIFKQPILDILQIMNDKFQYVLYEPITNEENINECQEERENDTEMQFVKPSVNNAQIERIEEQKMHRNQRNATNVWQKHLHQNNLKSVDVGADGNCSYRAISLHEFGTENHHYLLRLQAVKAVALHKPFFATQQGIYDDSIFANELIFKNCKHGEYNENMMWMALCLVVGKHIRVWQYDSYSNDIKIIFNSDNGSILPKTCESIDVAFVNAGHYRLLVAQDWKRHACLWKPLFSKVFNSSLFHHWSKVIPDAHFDINFDTNDLIKYFNKLNVTMEVSKANHQNTMNTSSKQNDKHNNDGNNKTYPQQASHKHNNDSQSNKTTQTNSLPKRPSKNVPSNKCSKQSKKSSSKTTNCKQPHQKKKQSSKRKCKSSAKKQQKTNKTQSLQKHKQSVTGKKANTKDNNKTEKPITNPPVIGSITTKPILVLAPKKFTQLKTYLKTKCKNVNDANDSFQKIRKQSNELLETLKQDETVWRTFYDPEICTVADREHFNGRHCLFKNCQLEHSHFHCGICQFHVAVGTRGNEFDFIKKHVISSHVEPHIKRISRKIKRFQKCGSNSNYNFSKLSECSVVVSRQKPDKFRCLSIIDYLSAKFLEYIMQLLKYLKIYKIL